MAFSAAQFEAPPYPMNSPDADTLPVIRHRKSEPDTSVPGRGCYHEPMPLATALTPLLGFFLALLAYWFWSRAREARTDAALQKRLWDHSKYQRDFTKATPLEVSEWFQAEQRKYHAYALVALTLAVLCFAYAAYHFTGLR